jgi:CheY-like chemotaxis protein
MLHIDNSSRDIRPIKLLFVGVPPVDLQAICDRSCSRPVDVDVVADGQTAIQRLTAAGERPTDDARPDLILLQYGFELPDGMTVLHAIKSSPYLTTVPVIVIDPDRRMDTTDKPSGNAHLRTPHTAEEYAGLIASIGQFWLEWVRYPAVSYSSNQ